MPGFAEELGVPSSRLPGWVWGGWNQILSAIRIHPALFFPLIRLRMLFPGAPAWHLVAADTEFVIEGYWRSGNTFAVEAFESAQNRPVRIAYHTHAAATVRRGVRLGRPVLVLARAPLDAVPGRMFLAPHLTPEHALREYVRFYRAIEPFAAGFVPATFDEVVTDLGAVVERVNARFGTAFRLPGRDGHSLSALAKSATFELPLLRSVPSEKIAAVREALRTQMRQSPLLHAAERVYRAFVARCTSEPETGSRLRESYQIGSKSASRMSRVSPAPLWESGTPSRVFPNPPGAGEGGGASPPGEG